MDSKKVIKSKLTASTPVINRTARTHLVIEPLESLTDSFEIGNSSEVKPLSQAKKTPMLNLICEAIQVLGVPRKGASYISIRKWILNNSKTAATNVRPIATLKRAFKTGLEKEVLGRPQRCKNFRGLTGCFIVMKKDSPKKKKLQTKPMKGKSKKGVNETKAKEKPQIKPMKGKSKKDVNETKAKEKPQIKPMKGKSKKNVNETKAKEKPQIKPMKGKSKRDVNKTKAKAKSAPNTQAANPTGRLNLSDSLVAEVKEKNTKSTKERKIKKSEIVAIKTPNTGISKFAAKRTLEVAVQMTPKTPMPLVIKTPYSRRSRVAAKRTPRVLAKRTPRVLAKRTPKTKIPTVLAKKTAKGTQLIVESRGTSKRTRKDKAISISKVKEPSHSIKEAERALPKSKWKTVNSEVQSKETKPKTLYSPYMKPASTDLIRKDLSDTELEVESPGRKSLKSYASDTDTTAIVSIPITFNTKEKKPKKKSLKK